MATLNFQILYPINSQQITLNNYDSKQTVKQLKVEIAQELNCLEGNVGMYLNQNIPKKVKEIKRDDEFNI